MSSSELILSFVSITIRKCCFAYAMSFIVIIATTFIFLKNRNEPDKADFHSGK